MGFGDKLKGLRTQAQEAVSQHKEEIQNAVEAVGAAANERTKGKYADRIAKVGDKVSSTVDKVGNSEDAPEAAVPVAEATAEEETPAPPAQPSSAPPDFA